MSKAQHGRAQPLPSSGNAKRRELTMVAAATRASAAWWSGWRRPLLFAGVTGFVLLLMPSILTAYPLLVLCHMLIFSIACLALNLLYGTTGLLSLGHATYFGVAAYTGAFLYRFSIVESLELYLLAGVLSSTVFAAVIGFFCVRTTKIFFAILTLAFSMVVHSVVVDGAVFRLFGGVGWEPVPARWRRDVTSSPHYLGRRIRPSRVCPCLL